MNKQCKSVLVMAMIMALIAMWLSLPLLGENMGGSAAAQTCEGDFDSDGDVDGTDLATFAAEFGRTDCAGNCEGDFNGDNDVDGSDIATFATDFGRTNCFGEVPESIAEAVANANNPIKTFPLLRASGAISGIRDVMPTYFPDVADLIAGGPEARDYMLQSFQGTPPFAEDLKLSIYAYALEQMGDPASLPTLQAFIGDNVTGELFMAPHFVTHGAKILLGDPDLEDAVFYSAIQMREVASQNGSTVQQEEITPLSTPTTGSCHRQYVLLDDEGDPITWLHPDGTFHEATVKGIHHFSNDVPQVTIDNFIEQVTHGGGTFVDDDPVFYGYPSKQFNCGGYAFRHLNRGRRWTAEPDDMFDVLATNTGLLTEVSESEAQPGDIVFYYKKGEARSGHVAELRRIEEGTIIVRNADHQSGLWEAPIDAEYFKGKWYKFGGGVSYPVHRIFRWVNGKPPNVKPDPSVIGNPDYCQDEVSSGIVYRGEGTYRDQLSVDYGEAGSATCTFPAPVEITLNSDGSAHAAVTYFGYASVDSSGNVWCSDITGNVSRYYGTHANGQFLLDMGGGRPPLEGTYDGLGIVGTWEHNWEHETLYWDDETQTLVDGTQYHSNKLFFSVEAIFFSADQ
jgi:hypothetical protein